MPLCNDWVAVWLPHGLSVLEEGGLWEDNGQRKTVKEGMRVGGKSEMERRKCGAATAKESMGRPRVLLIVGSLRELSFNRQMAECVQALLGDRADSTILDWRDVPVFNQDWEFPAPPAVARVRRAVSDADGLWIFTPEYNHGVPGGLKNLLDWLSRPVEEGALAVIEGKVATVSGVGGSGCVRHCFASLLPTMDFLKLDVPAATFTGASFDRSMFTANALTLDDDLMASLEHQARALLRHVPKGHT